MTPLDPARAAITRRAAEGARLTRLAAAPRPRTGRRTQQAIDALLRLRTEIALGAAHADLLERIDDELFSLRRAETKKAAPKGGLSKGTRPVPTSGDGAKL